MMQTIGAYVSPLGEILLAADDVGLCGLWLPGQKYFDRCPDAVEETEEHPVLQTARQWLHVYFTGKDPGFSVPLHLAGTAFQKEVWDILCTIPYGKTTTYGAIAKELAAKRGLSRMSAQAVGGAVGHNPVSIIVPCHRVVGAHGNLTGYAGGIQRKIELLTLEHVDLAGFFIPKKGSAL